MCVCTWESIAREPIARDCNNMCRRMCADVLTAHSSCVHAYDVHTPLSPPPESSTGTPVCPFRCSVGYGSGEGQIVYVYLLTSLTCWCSLVNVLRVKHLLFFSSSAAFRLSCTRPLLLLPLPFSPLHRCPYTPPPIIALSSSSSWCIILGLSSPRHRMRISPLRPRTRASILLSHVCCPRETCSGGEKNPVPLLRNTLPVRKFLSSTIMRDMYNIRTLRACAYEITIAIRSRLERNSML
jgi:hypothetical protein